MECYCKHNNEKVEYVSKLVKLLYEDLHESAGGMLHIVLDDGNLEDDDIQWCIEYCNREENKDRADKYLCLEIAHRMLTMNMYERRLVYYGDFGFECEKCCDKCIIENEEEWDY